MKENVAFRSDIQGLRAVSVLSVLVFHLWPEVLPGGYVGVDVFFVISGYLITSALLRQIEATGKVSLAKFYGGRIRRLLPAATFVLLIVGLAMPLLPPANMRDVAGSLVASALYVENWRLAEMAVDYLNADGPASPVQHYWSLAIEEQFYVAWPLLVIFAGVIAQCWRRLSFLTLLLWILAVVTVLSFSVSVVLTRADPAYAYFATHARIWELGSGGLLAVLSCPKPRAVLAGAMRATGLLLILASAFAFSASTAFPGYWAVLPVAGALLLIASGDQQDSLLYPVLSSAAFQRIGDISYSVYLWHWPLIVFYLSIFGLERLSLAEGIVLLTASLLAGYASKVLIEDPIRYRKVTLPPFAFVPTVVVAVFSCIAVPLLTLSVLNSQNVVASTHTDKRLLYPGAAALFEKAAVPPTSEFLPPIHSARGDYSDVYRDKCHLDPPAEVVRSCEFGDRNSNFHVVLAGDSKATNWLPALRSISEQQRWRVTLQTKSACPILDVPVVRLGKEYAECLVWGQNVLKWIESEKPDLIIYSQSALQRLYPEHNNDTMVEAIFRTFERMKRSGARILVMADTPNLPEDLLGCLGTKPPEDCFVRKTEIERFDPIVPAANKAGATIVNMIDAFCPDGICPEVVGNVIVWRDRGHFTRTYSRSLAPYLQHRLTSVGAH